jgi:hypothetical protein
VGRQAEEFLNVGSRAKILVIAAVVTLKSRVSDTSVVKTCCIVTVLDSKLLFLCEN